MSAWSKRIAAALATVALYATLSPPPGFAESRPTDGEKFASTPNHPMMLGDFASPVWEKELDNGVKVVDIDATLDSLDEANVNTYAYIISGGSHYGDGKTGPLEITQNQWERLPAFVEAAADRGIDVYVYISPPSGSALDRTVPRPEQEPGLNPFGWDYVAWAESVAALSTKYPNIGGLIIDDFDSNTTAANSPWSFKFTPEYVRGMSKAAKAKNPRFQLFGIIYQPASHVAASYRNALDGIVFPYRSETGIPGTGDSSKVRAEGETYGDIAHCLSGHSCLQFFARSHVAENDQAAVTLPFEVVDARAGHELTLAMNDDGYLVKCPDGACFEFRMLGHTLTQPGDHASISQMIKVDSQGPHVLSLWLGDSARRNVNGYHFVEVLIDDQVAASYDVGPEADAGYQSIDITDAIGERSEFKLTVRLHEAQSVDNFGVRAWVDDISVTGASVKDGSFSDRRSGAWSEHSTLDALSGRYTSGEYALEVLVGNEVVKQIPIAKYQRWHNVSVDLGPALEGVEKGVLGLRLKALDSGLAGRNVWIDDVSLAGTSLTAKEFDQRPLNPENGEAITAERVSSFETLFMVYASRLAADPKGHQPSPEYIREVQTVGLELIKDGYFDGSLVYVLNLDAPVDHPDGLERAIIGELYGDFEATHEAWCDRVLTGPLSSVRVAEGRTCLRDARITDGVTLDSGAELTVTSSYVGGGIAGHGNLAICGSQVRSGVNIDGAAEVRLGANPHLCTGSRIQGGVRLHDVSDSLVVASQRVRGGLRCDATPMPTSRGTKNSISGPITGPCRQL